MVNFFLIFFVLYFVICLVGFVDEPSILTVVASIANNEIFVLLDILDKKK